VTKTLVTEHYVTQRLALCA